MVSYFIMDYPFDVSGGSSFFVATSDGKGDMYPSTTYLSSRKVDYWIYGGGFVSSQIRDYPSMIYYDKYRYYYFFYHSGEDKFITDGDGRGGVVPITTCRNLLSIDSRFNQNNPRAIIISRQIQNRDTEPNSKYLLKEYFNIA